MTVAELVGAREKVVHLIELMATRMQWLAGRSLLLDAGIHVSRGWADTIETARGDTQSEESWDAAYKKLAEAVRLHTYVGNKHVSFFDLRVQTEVRRNKLLEWAKNSATSDLEKVLKEKPFDLLEAPTSEEDLEEYKNSAPNLVHLKQQKNRLFLQFFSVRRYLQREPISISGMTSSQQKVFSKYDELIGVKTKSIPCFDTVVIDYENDLVEVRLDFRPGMTQVKETPAFQLIVNALNSISQRFINQLSVDAGLIDLHPAITPLYKDEKCGRVTSLGFVATGKDSSSNNRGQLHRVKSKDFRQDAFHTGGKSSVERIDPYTIGITWENKPPKSDLYLELHGNAKSVYNSTLSSVVFASIVGCSDHKEFDFVSNSVLSRIEREPKK